MKTLSGLSILVLCFFMSTFTTINAQDTKVMIRAKAKDAKFIGSSIGGAQILVKNAQTGAVLAEGVTTGSTGNTTKIMTQPHKRTEDLSDDKTGGFMAKLAIDEPVFLTVEVLSPINDRQSQVLASTQFWAIPGKDITGDGIVLEIPGFIVDILSPQRLGVTPANDKVEIKANIVMMCGCPITKGGLWDSDQYEVKALISSKGGTNEEVELNITDKTSTFAGEVDLDPGLYEVVVYAYDPDTGNTGVDKTNIVVR